MLTSLFARAEILPEQFAELCRHRYHRLGRPEWTPGPMTPGRLFWAPTTSLISTQGRFSLHKLNDNIEEELEREDKPDKDRKPKEAIVGIYWGHKIFVIDGHHRALTNIALDRKWSRVRLLAASDLPYAEFLEFLKAYAYREHGQMLPQFYDWWDMVDDPNLYLMRLATARVMITADAQIGYTIAHLKGSKLPVLAKINQGPQYFELRGANDLHGAGVHYDPAWDKDLPSHILDAMYSIFSNARWANDPRLLVLPPYFERDGALFKRRTLIHWVTCQSRLAPPVETLARVVGQ